MASALGVNFLVELDSLERLAVEWDALAVSTGQPFMAPGWALPWWRYIAPKRAFLRVIEVRDGDELVGLAPFFAARSRLTGRVDYRLLGIELGAPLALLAARGRERQVAEAAGRALSQADPRPDLIALQGTRLASRWHDGISDGWSGPSRPIALVYRTRPYQSVGLHGVSLEAWLAARSNTFRSKMRRLGRRFEEEGGSWRKSTEATLREDIDTFQRLHAARWRDMGESTFAAYGQRVGDMLCDVGRTLLADERLRVWVMEIDGEPIATDIYVCAGGVVTGVNCGWDERWKRLSPPLLATMRTIEDSISRGESRVDMGPGEESHKTRFSDCNSPIAWSVVMAPGRRLAQTFALTAPTLANSRGRDLVKRVLEPDQVDALRELRRKVRR